MLLLQLSNRHFTTLPFNEDVNASQIVVYLQINGTGIDRVHTGQSNLSKICKKDAAILPSISNLPHLIREQCVECDQTHYGRFLHAIKVKELQRERSNAGSRSIKSPIRHFCRVWKEIYFYSIRHFADEETDADIVKYCSSDPLVEMDTKALHRVLAFA